MPRQHRWSLLEDPATESVRACCGDEVVFRYHYRRGEIAEARLAPMGDIILGGIGNITGWHLTWGRFNGGRPAAEPTWQYSTDGKGVTLSFRGIDASDGDCTYDTAVTVSRDGRRATYVYDVETKLTVRPGCALRWGPYNDIYEGLEFLNFYPSGAFDDMGAGPIDDGGRLHARSWRGPERYRAWVFQNQKRQWECMPLNHIVNSPSYARQSCRNALWMLVGEADRVPTVQLVGDTYKHAHVGICHWLYDMHFNSLPPVNPLPAGTVLRAQFRIFDTPVAKAERLWKKARVVPVPEREKRATAFPATTRSGLDLFTEGVHHERYDPHRFWRPFIENPQGKITRYHDDAFVLGDECLQRYRIPKVTGVRFGWHPSAPGRLGGYAFVRTRHEEMCGWQLGNIAYYLVSHKRVNEESSDGRYTQWKESAFHWGRRPCRPNDTLFD